MAKNKVFSLSANIENGIAEGSSYIVTPNVEKVLQEIVNGFHTGIHSFSIIGTYGTGKSSFLLNLEKDLMAGTKHKVLLKNPKVLHNGSFEILNILGDSESLSDILLKVLRKATGVAADDPITLLNSYYTQVSKDGKLLLIVIDEFGKVLEHAAKYDPEKDLYFFQKLTEFVNASGRNILLLATLHQNFSAYAGKLTQIQKNEWNKVKGRFQEIVFAEPVEQLIFLAAEHISSEKKLNVEDDNFCHIHQLAIDHKFINSSIGIETARKLYPLDSFAAYIMTKAIQRYGQNERSLFSFLNTRGNHSVLDFMPKKNLTYNLSEAYDYIQNSFYSSINDANVDSMSWSSIRMSIERVEGSDWKTPELMLNAIKIVKAIGLMNLFGNAGFSMAASDIVDYSSMAMNIEDAKIIVKELERLKIIRFAEYKKRMILFEGSDINIEEEIAKASMIVPRPVNFVDQLRVCFNDRISPVKAYYYHRGTPRFFKYELRPEAQDIVPVGAVDGYIEMIFSTVPNVLEELKQFSAKCDHANIFVYFKKTDQIIEHLYNIQIYRHIYDNVLIDKNDRVAAKEIKQLLNYEKTLLNKTINTGLFSYSQDVVWLFKGKVQEVRSQREFNQLLSKVCEDVYYKTPVLNNELINKHKISGNISAAKQKYLQALLENSNKEDLGFEADKFPPEKTIYYSLLKNTGLHVNGEMQDAPDKKDFMPLWEACEEFLRSTADKPRKLSELVSILTAQPYKIKEGLLDFWLPTYLYVKRQEYALYGLNGQYIPNFNIELFDLMKKHIGDFRIKAFAVDGVKLQLFNQYRKFLNIDHHSTINGDAFIETIKPFLFFYNRQLNDYAKQTNRIDHRETLRFREVIANAKDPEKAFLEDLPEAMGYDYDRLKNQQEVQAYCGLIQRAVRELRGCYSQLIDRIEDHFIAGVGLQSVEYETYIQEVQKRLSKVKLHLLSPRQKEFYQHAVARFDNRVEWYQSVCYAVLGSPLDRMKDSQESKLLDDIVFLFRECEKQAVISEGLNYQIGESEIKRSAELEDKIESILSGENNLDVYTLMRILQKKMNYE